MEVITIESKTYKELVGKIDKTLRYVVGKEREKEMYRDVLINNEELAEMLGISTRTLQRLRSANQISYKMVNGRCAYDLSDIEQAIREKTLYCNPKTLDELRKNFKLRSKAESHGTVR